MSKDRMQKFKAELSYIGSRYYGFVTQLQGPTVQSEVERALEVILRCKVRVFCASRTDSGVHAEHQVLVFSAPCEYCSTWIVGLNAVLPEDIKFRSLLPVGEDFDPVNDAKAKVYRYRLWRGPCTSPFARPYVWQQPRDLALSRVVSQLPMLVGTHNFSSFCASDSHASTRVRQVFEVQVFERGQLIEFWIVGKGFLKQMVRIIVGTFVDLARDRLHCKSIECVLAQMSRRCAGQTAPPQGLSLVRIDYSEVPRLEDVLGNTRHGLTWMI